MKRILTSLVLATTLGVTLNATTAIALQPESLRPHGPCVGLRDDPPRLIRCAFRWAGIPGQIPTALAIAYRESRYNEAAYNASGCAGLFQMMLRYWPSRVRSYLHQWWFPRTWPNVSAFNGRANALVAAAMVRSGGWEPWEL